MTAPSKGAASPSPPRRYRGDGLRPDGTGERHPYRPSEALVKAVNIAIHLNRPLLVKGPPGSGKTRLAYSVAHELGFGPDRVHSWYVKSTSRARDGLYTIDMVRRLQDAQLDDPKAQSLVPYITFGPLGTALRTPGESVVLIDEIDKADIDFPNDLLRELDERKFEIEELSQEGLTPQDEARGVQRLYEGGRPVVIITSNDEKDLPAAFLRRCVFHYIDFPSPAELLDIVRLNTPGLAVADALVGRAIEDLQRLRAVGNVIKLPETSDLIDWVRILHAWGVDLAALEATPPPAPLPHWEVLYKHQRDLTEVRKQLGIPQA